MIARVVRVQVGPEHVSSVVAAYREGVRPFHEHSDGLLHHYFLGDRTRGEIMIVGVWESADAVSRIADLEPARQRFWAVFGQDPVVEVFEVLDVIDR